MTGGGPSSSWKVGGCGGSAIFYNTFLEIFLKSFLYTAIFYNRLFYKDFLYKLFFLSGINFFSGIFYNGLFL